MTAEAMQEARDHDERDLAETAALETETEGESEADETPAPAPAAPVVPMPPRPVVKPKIAKPAPAPRPAGPLADIGRREEIELRDWIGGFGQSGTIKIDLFRNAPQMFRGVKTNGHLDSYDEPFDEQFIKENWGGGTYNIRIKRAQGDTGKLTIVTSRIVQIAGDPKVSALVHKDDIADAMGQVGNNAPAVPAAPTHDPLVSKTFDLMAAQNQRLEERLDRAAQRPAPLPEPKGLDMQTIAAITRPFELTIAKLEQRLDQMVIARDAPTTEDKVKDRFLDKLLDQDTARMQNLRDTYDSEIRQLKENHREDQKRAADHHDRELTRLDTDYKLRVGDLKSNAESTLTAVRAAYEQRLGFLTRDVDLLQKKIDTQEAELKELRAKKDKSPIELIKDFNAIKEALGGDEEEQGGIAGVVGKIVDSPVAEKVAERLMQGLNGGGGPMPAVGVPFRGADGAAWVNNGQAIVPYKSGKKKKRKDAEEADGEDGEGKKEKEDDGKLEVDKEAVTKAVAFLEGSFRANTAPEMTAQSIRSFVPGEILVYISRHGVDPLLDQVAGLSKTSPLSQQSGRNWVRKVAKVLVGE